jgi:hypothetical protein
MEPPRPGWALTLQGLASLPPTQRRRHLLFGDLLEDVGAAASIFPSGLVEVPYRMPDPGIWTQSRELPAERQNRLLGVLRAAEARGRVRALRLRYTRMRVSRNPRTPHRGREDRPSLREGVDGWAQPGRSWGAVRCSSASSRPQAEEIALLIQRQDSARAAMRLELFLPPQLKPTRIPDPLNRQEVPASPGKVGGLRASAHTGPNPSPYSGGAWRPSWKRPWMTESSRDDSDIGVRLCPTLTYKVLFPGLFGLPCHSSLRPRREEASMDIASPTSQSQRAGHRSRATLTK